MVLELEVCCERESKKFAEGLDSLTLYKSFGKEVYTVEEVHTCMHGMSDAGTRLLFKGPK